MSFGVDLSSAISSALQGDQRAQKWLEEAATPSLKVGGYIHPSLVMHYNVLNMKSFGLLYNMPTLFKSNSAVGLLQLYLRLSA